MQAEADRRVKEDHKRLKSDVGALENVLYQLFERQPRWTINKLCEETKQMPSHLRPVLEKVGSLPV